MFFSNKNGRLASVFKAVLQVFDRKPPIQRDFFNCGQESPLIVTWIFPRYNAPRSKEGQMETKNQAFVSEVNIKASDASGELHHAHDHVHGPGCSHHHHVETYVRSAPKTGRNDPCPCGSGKKFKKCCGGVQN
jgi:hypothetical protein